MNLVAIDLGKFRSVACLYRSDDDVTYRTIETSPQAVHDLLVECSPERLVVEVGTVTGWVHDIEVSMGIEVQVANPNTEGWRWKRGKRKTDRDDALKLARIPRPDLVLNPHIPLVKKSKPVNRQSRGRYAAPRPVALARQRAFTRSVLCVLPWLMPNKWPPNAPAGDFRVKGTSRSSLARGDFCRV